MNKKSLTVNYETAREFSFQYADICTCEQKYNVETCDFHVLF